AWVFTQGSCCRDELDRRRDQGHAAARAARGGEGAAGRMSRKPENRVDKIIADLLRGRRLKLRGGDAEEKATITAAARLAGARQGPQRMQDRKSGGEGKRVEVG